MEKEIKAFQIDLGDNVATALAGIKAGQEAGLTGDRGEESIKAAADIPAGHKIALKDIGAGGHIVKYGVVIGRATADIPKGSWVHLLSLIHIFGEQALRQPLLYPA